MTNILHHEHTRFVYQFWHRNPEGEFIKKDNVPWGNRTPNNFIWGHSINDFFYIEREQGLRVLTIWSRSMIKAFGENYLNIEHEYEPLPRLLRPWPVLRLSEGLASARSEEVTKYRALVGLVDEGCAYNHLNPPMSAVDVDEMDYVVRALDMNKLGSDSDASDKPSAPSGSQKNTIPKLEETIPPELLPEVLIVKDPRAITLRYLDSRYDKQRTSATNEIRYKRVYPLPRPRDAGSDLPAREAKLDYTIAERLGTGHHSLVYRTTLTLPEPFTAKASSGSVTVAAKTAFNQYGVDFREDSKELLKNEAKMYDQFPAHLSEHYCGYNLVPPNHYPVPAGAVVPKFYGYYLPENRSARESPILLVEECGSAFDPDDLTPDQRTECWTLFLRLHAEEFLHNSVYIRNMLRQPGPLTVPPSARSLNTPSFRLIDFGRTENTVVKYKHSELIRRWRESLCEREGELRDAMKELKVTV